MIKISIIILLQFFACKEPVETVTNQDKILQEIPSETQAKIIDGSNPINENKSVEISESKEPETIKNTGRKIAIKEKKIAISKPKTVKASETNDPNKIIETEGKKILTPEEKPKENVIVEKEKEKDVSNKNNEAEVELKDETPEIKDVVSHATFDQLLSKYVSNGKVDYIGFKSDVDKLDDYLTLISKNKPAKTYSKNARLAYWINVYNAYTIKLILDNYPVNSIMDISGGKPWDKKWISIGNENYSLNNIENDIIRPVFNDSRIHFAVNCAALSCPPIANKAYTESNLNSLLETQTKNFINNSNFNTVNKNKISVSKIFDWYKEDFGNIIDFINKYASQSVDSNAPIDYVAYDWKLNKK